MHAHYDGQAETMSLLLKQHCHESSSISPCLVALYYMMEAKGAYKEFIHDPHGFQLKWWVAVMI